MQPAARARFVVVEVGARRVDDEVAPLAQPEAEIDVVQRDLEPLVEAADFLEDAARTIMQAAVTALTLRTTVARSEVAERVAGRPRKA